MVTVIPLLQSVRIASPCDASWDEMAPVDGDRVRFCDGCRKRVYNLSALCQAEAEGLLRAHEVHLCVRYYRRRDGTILTADCPVGLAAARRLVLMRARASVGLCALLCLALAAHQARQGPPPTAAATEATTGLVDTQAHPLMGAIAITPPAPKPAPPEPTARMGRVIMGKPALIPTNAAGGAELGETARVPTTRTRTRR